MPHHILRPRFGWRLNLLSAARLVVVPNACPPPESNSEKTMPPDGLWGSSPWPAPSGCDLGADGVVLVDITRHAGMFAGIVH